MADAPEIRPTHSLRLRVATAVAAVLALGGVVVVWSALVYGRQAAREVYDGLLVGAASDIAETISVRDGAASVVLPVSAFELLGQAPDDRVRYLIVAPDGTPITGDAATPRPPDGAAEPALYDADFGDEPARYVALTRRFAERSYSGPVQVIVGQTMRARQALAREIAQSSLIGLGLAGVAIAVLAWGAVARALTPLSRLSDTLAARAPTDLTPVTGTAPSEIAAVQTSLNTFMHRLQRQSEASGKLIADTAHQLRTPVAGIRAQLQTAADAGDAAEREAALVRAERQTEALNRLLDQMLAHAMVNHRAEVVLREVVDLRDIAVEVLEACDDLILRDGTGVHLRLPDAAVRLEGDELSLVEAGKNLLTNALRHGRAPITLGVDAETRAIYVEDSGPGPTEAPEALAQRHMTGRSGGGLGLAIAHDVARVHSGVLRFHHAPGGFRAALEFA
ncbi:two-component system sensor protein [Oceanicola granulosus HTCC2516]|uniref:histidine kinase n=1 Tax=Oceanicola granulosus (strain ATCC BAA-861 / DSM 15982 / KCTC 12143 / HTCC2516) TaxID=314256 RepID=Q2CF26_OCEGH|nr:sensor histidine kinase [Oceanicola granulosus]EAR51301.1 two-component system sensor protein [Oceanicola granulosus HTCC2516]